MKQKITLNDISGYATERMVWQLMLTLADQNESGKVGANDVVVEKNGFSVQKSGAQEHAANVFCAPETFQNNEAFKTEASDVWTIGALAFFFITGMNVFEGKGGASQTPSTPVPRIGSVYASETLSSTIRQCLNYLPEKRPSKELLSRVAKENLEKMPQPQKRLTTHSGRVYATSLVKFWPEEMVPLLSIMLFFFFSSPIFAQKNAFDQTAIPNEMKTLVMRCVDLRSTANTEKVKKAMARDMNWTMMDELPIDKQGECATKQPVDMFGINDIGFSILKQHGGVTNSGGRFRDGRDPRYHYSFIEVTVRKNASVTYPIGGREGKQLFAIVPFERDARFSATIPNGKNFTENGVCYIQLKQPLKKTDNFKLTIKNESGRNAAFVIINYNSRKNE